MADRPRQSAGPEDLSTEQLICRDLRHAWVFAGDTRFWKYAAGGEGYEPMKLSETRAHPQRLVRITRTSVCDRGCGCRRYEELEVPSFKRLSKPVIVYEPGYQIRGGGKDVEDFRREYYARTSGLRSNVIEMRRKAC